MGINVGDGTSVGVGVKVGVGTGVGVKVGVGVEVGVEVGVKVGRGVQAGVAVRVGTTAASDCVPVDGAGLQPASNTAPSNPKISAVQTPTRRCFPVVPSG